MNPATGTTESGSARNRHVDNARNGSKVVRKQDCGFEMDFGPTTLEEEFMRGGWDRNNSPECGPAPRRDTSGMRGEPSGGAIDDDDPSRFDRRAGY